MNHRRNPFGTGPEVSLFTLGTMRSIQSIDQMYSVLKKACLIGINHIETAHAYGPAEDFLGKSLEKLNHQGIQPKDDWIITSKILPGISLANGKNQIKEILSRLKRSKLHNLAIHGINLSKHLQWALKGEGSELIRWAKNESLIEQVGFSSHGSFSLIEEAINSQEFDFCSLHLHLLDQARIPLAQQALKNGMGVMAISPADKGGHIHTPSQTLIQDCSPIRPLELVYRFLLSQGISTLTLGACKAEDLSLAQELINSNSSLTKLEETSIKNLIKKSKERLKGTYCEQCNQCLPCPNEVPIPDLLRLRNIALGHGQETFSKERYNLIGKAGHWWETHNATACERCGDCLPRCPYNLHIPDLLEELHLKFEDSPRRRLWG